MSDPIYEAETVDEPLPETEYVALPPLVLDAHLQSAIDKLAVLGLTEEEARAIAGV